MLTHKAQTTQGTIFDQCFAHSYRLLGCKPCQRKMSAAKMFISRRINSNPSWHLFAPHGLTFLEFHSDFKICEKYYKIMDLSPLLRSSRFRAVSWKIVQNHVLPPPPRVGAPSYGGSWIRPARFRKLQV